jgi:glycosyltransferase involved in cell wall biosynthesis
MAHIAMLLIGDIRYDGRVRKEIRTLTAGGHRLDLVLSDFGNHSANGNDLGVTTHDVPMTLWSDPLRNFWEQLNFNRRAASIIEKLKPTHIHCHDLSTLLAGVSAKKKTRAKLIFDAHELMPESCGGIRKAIWDYIEKRCVASCDNIIMPEKNRIAYFKQKHVNILDPVLLENFPSKAEIPTKKINLFRNLYPIKRDQKIVLYSGGVGPGRHVEELIDSMAVCSDKFVLIILGLAFKGYAKLLAANVKKLGLGDRVFFHDAVPYTDILRYMASCDVGTAFYRNTDVNNYYCASNKVYEYIALDKVLVTNDYPGLVEAVEKNRQGICVAEVTAYSLKEAYTRASDSAVTPGRRKFFWEDQHSALIQLYQK